ncbi:MAG: hypothetical protein O3A46_09455, partial [Candidatus Poribacteria bacterium]|nr:hypothetical protein [Candidatus Poribacteria bacterium]
MTRPNALALFAILSMIASIARADSSFVQTHCYWDDLRLFEGRIEVLSTPTMTRFGTYQLRLRSRDGSPIPAKVEWQVPIGTEGDGHVRAQVYATATDALADSIAIRADRPGSYQIVAVVTPLNGYGRTESFVRYLRVEADGTTTTPDAFAYDEATMPPLDKEVRMRAATVLANEVEYTGRFTYHDDNTGFQEPVRDATVELVEEVPSGPFTVEQTRESTRTSADGRFAFTPILATNNGQTRRFRVRASLTNQTIELTDSNQTLYRRQTELMNAAAGQTVDLTLQWAFGEASHMVGHVFNVMLDERDFLSRTVNFTRPRIRVLFPTSKGGTFYGYTFRNDQVIAEEINVLFDHRTRRGPLLHEYAHACMTTLADGRASRIPQWTGVADDLPNPHSLHTVSDEGFALSEGWAEWMEAVVDDDALNLRSFSNANEPNVENNKWWTGRSDGRGSNTRGEIVEGAVASILWDIIDTPSSKDLTPGVDDDPVTVGEQNFARIWQIFDETNPLSILKVRTEWVNRNLPNRSEVLGIFNANAIPSERRGTDVNADDDINLLDLVIVAQKFMQSGPFPAPSPDINSGGIVNIVDLVL